MSIKSRVGSELRTWGWRRSGGLGHYSSLRAHGLAYRRRTSTVGTLFYAARGSVPRKPEGARLVLGDQVSLNYQSRLCFEGPTASIEIGDQTTVGRRTEIRAAQQVRIGRDCAISWDVQILDTDYHELDGAPCTAPVVIGDHVWIGFGATVLKGVTIGDGAVVAARSLVTSDVPARALVAGLPASVRRSDVSWVR